MIRINLLAAHEVRKGKGRFRLFQGIVLAYGILITAILLGYWKLGVEVQALREEKGVLVKQTQAAATLQKEIKELKEKKETAQTRLTLLQNLEKERHGPVRLLEVLSTILPVNQLWLISLRETGSEVRIDGMSFSNETLAEYMRRLQNAPFVSQVDLVQSTQANYKNLKVKQFTLTARLKSPAPTVENTVEKK